MERDADDGHRCGRFHARAERTGRRAGQAPAEASAGEQVAGALERIAARVRDGEINVPAGSDLSDEAALSAVLTALLRQRR